MIEFLKRLFSKRDDPDVELSGYYGETQELIGQAVAEYIPQYAIIRGALFDIKIGITRHPNAIGDKETINLKMCVDGNLDIQMMEYPIDA